MFSPTLYQPRPLTWPCSRRALLAPCLSQARAVARVRFSVRPQAADGAFDGAAQRRRRETAGSPSPPPGTDAQPRREPLQEIRYAPHSPVISPPHSLHRCTPLTAARDPICPAQPSPLTAALPSPLHSPHRCAPRCTPLTAARGPIGPAQGGVSCLHVSRPCGPPHASLCLCARAAWVGGRALHDSTGICFDRQMTRQARDLKST